MRKILMSAVVLLGVISCGNSQNKQEADTQAVEETSEVKPVELTTADFLAKVANYKTSPNEWKYLGDKPAIVDFYAPWCGPCKIVAPILEDLQAEYGDSIVVYKVNTDNEQELASVFGITSIPSLLFIPTEGKPQMTQGAMGKEDFRKVIDDFLLKKKP